MTNKLEYLRMLESILKVHLTKREVDEIMRDYAEYFVEGARQGKSDDEIAFNLGDPREVANQIISETLGRAGDYAAEAQPSRPAGRRTPPPPRVKKDNGDSWSRLGGCLWKGFLIFLGICLLPGVIMVVFALLGALAALLCALGGVVVALGACILGALAAIVVACVYVGVLPASALACVFLASVGIIAGSILGICLMLVVIRWLWNGTVWCCRRIYYWIARKPMPLKTQRFGPPPAGAYRPSDPDGQPQPATPEAGPDGGQPAAGEGAQDLPNEEPGPAGEEIEQVQAELVPPEELAMLEERSSAGQTGPEEPGLPQEDEQGKEEDTNA